MKRLHLLSVLAIALCGATVLPQQAQAQTLSIGRGGVQYNGYGQGHYGGYGRGHRDYDQGYHRWHSPRTQTYSGYGNGPYGYGMRNNYQFQSNGGYGYGNGNYYNGYGNSGYYSQYYTPSYSPYGFGIYIN